MSYITSIDLRRVTIADEERGLVFGLSMFRHPMEQKRSTRSGHGVYVAALFEERLVCFHQI